MASRSLESFRSVFGRLLARSVELIAATVAELPDRQSRQPVTTAFFNTVRTIESWPESQRCFDMCQHSPELRRLRIEGDGAALTNWVLNVLHDAVERYRVLGPPGEIDGVRIRRVTRELIRWASSKSVPIVATTPLIGVVAPEPVFLRTAEFRLRRLTMSEVIEHRRFAHMHDPQPDLLAIVTRVDDLETRSGVSSTARAFIAALELVMDTAIYEGETLARPEIPYFGLDRSESWLVPAAPAPDIGLRRHYVDRTKLALASQTLAGFRKLRGSRQELALNLYEQYLRTADERARAAFVGMGLEALFVPSGNAELRYRFALHVAAWQRSMTFKSAQRLYDARSAVVHASANVDGEIGLLVSEGAQLLRGTLLLMKVASERRRLSRIAEEVVDRVETGRGRS